MSKTLSPFFSLSSLLLLLSFARFFFFFFPYRVCIQKTHNRTFCISDIQETQMNQSPVCIKIQLLFNKHKSYGCV
ncbi:hypothetical protein HanPSC8_Chr17g0792681 [Helianthus annuus]|nr:hypothetical protein HanPSC8_Chr17g0792681 [Helianthus annuus]